MRRLVILIGFSLLSLTIAASVAAQAAACSDMVTKALNDLSSSCGGMSRNSACYGYNHVTATFMSALSPQAFSQPDDRVDLASLQTITTSPLDLQTSQWGIAVIKAQANLPDALPGQAVTFLLLGDVSLKTGVTADSDLKPMQAIYFTTGIGDTKCSGAPDSSLIIQGPKDITVKMRVNGADISLGSTLVFRSTPNSSMSCGVIDGAATVGDTNQVIPAGFAARVPLDSSLNANGDWGGNQTLSNTDADSLQVLKAVPQGVLNYTPDVPTSQEEDIMGALDPKLVTALDPHILRDMVHLLVDEGATPEMVGEWDVPTMRAYLANNAASLPAATQVVPATETVSATEEPSIADTLQAVLNALDQYTG